MAQAQLYRPIELPYVTRHATAPAIATTLLLDAAGEEAHFTGYVMFEDPTAAPKVISAAGGGKIHWRAGSPITFATAGSQLNIGIQDTSTVTSPAQGDGTFDVSAALIAATDTITADTYYATPMESGTKTLSHGQLVSIGFQLSVRNGADSLIISSITSDNAVGGRCNMPATTLKTGGTFAVVLAVVPNVGIEFDDGTVAWLMGAENLDDVSTVAANVDSATADEYGNFIQLPAPMTIHGISAVLSIAADTADFEALVYSDPLGTPTLVASRTIDATQLASTGAGAHQFLFSTPVLLQKDTPYAFTLRPITTGNITYRFNEFGDAKFNKLNGLNGNAYSVRRIDNAGAFSDYNVNGAKTRIMQMSALLQTLPNDNGLGAGATGPMAYIYT